MDEHDGGERGGAPLGDWLTLAEAAERLGAKHDRLRRAAVEGRLQARKLGRSGLWLVRPGDVEHFLKTSRRGPQPGARKTGKAKE
jgi:excisionase family DNA binding protein